MLQLTSSPNLYRDLRNLNLFHLYLNLNFPSRVILPFPFFFFLGTVLTSRQPAILGYQNITFDRYILILCNSNITCDSSFVTFGGFLIFFLTFDNFILILCNFNITFDTTFVIIGGSLLLLFVAFDGSSSRYVVPTLHVIVLLLHSMVLLFFSHI